MVFLKPGRPLDGGGTWGWMVEGGGHVGRPSGKHVGPCITGNAHMRADMGKVGGTLSSTQGLRYFPKYGGVSVRVVLAGAPFNSGHILKRGAKIRKNGNVEDPPSLAALGR